MKTCPVCGHAIERGGRAGGPLPTYCSAACKNQARRERERESGVTELRRVQTQERRDLERALRSTKTCPYCDAQMENPRRKQCGKTECKRRFNADRMRIYMRERRTTDPEFAARHRAYDRKAQERAIVCEQCGKPAVVTKRTARYCGYECWQLARKLVTQARRVQRAKEQAVLHSQVVPWSRPPRWMRLAGPVRQPRPSVWTVGICPCCGESFVTIQPEGRYCSRRCQRRMAKDRRRALKRDAYVGPISRRVIFERDGWTCHICGDPVDRDAQVPDLAAATLDHVVPLARGGEHSETNLKTAHFYCNSVKSDLEDGWSALAA